MTDRDPPDGVAVLGVDDQPIFLDVAREVVVATPGFEWVGGAASGVGALDAVARLSPALVLLDVNMPGMNGIETAQRISEDHPDVVVILISVDASSTIAPEAASAGAVALVRKQELGPGMLRLLWETHGAAA